jgi:hypothetical protein
MSYIFYGECIHFDVCACLSVIVHVVGYLGKCKY